MTSDELAAIKVRNEERKNRKRFLSKGPWTIEEFDRRSEDNPEGHFAEIFGGRGLIIGIADAWHGCESLNPKQKEQTWKDLEFCCFARNDMVEADIDALLAEVKELHFILEGLRK